MDIFPWSYICQNKQTVLLWAAAPDRDYFLTYGGGELIQADTISDLHAIYVKESYRIHWDKATQINFDNFWDAVENLEEHRASSTKTCKLLLDGWNFIEDMVNTFSLEREMEALQSERMSAVYRKIFEGNNLAGEEGGNEPYHPLWEEREIEALRSELGTIWKIFLENGYIRCA